jgi:hypothetical protein
MAGPNWLIQGESPVNFDVDLPGRMNPKTIIIPNDAGGGITKPGVAPDVLQTACCQTS